MFAFVCLFFLKGSDAPIQLTSHTSNMASSKQMDEPQKKLSGNLGEHMVGLRMKLVVRTCLRKLMTNFLQKRTQIEGIKEKGTRKKREYVPQKRSGGYAVLLTLYRHTQVKQAHLLSCYFVL